MERAMVVEQKLTSAEVERPNFIKQEVAAEDMRQVEENSWSHLETIYVKTETPDAELEAFTVKDEPIHFKQEPKPDEVVTVPSKEAVNEDSHSQKTPLLVTTQSPAPTPGPSPSPCTSASASGTSKRKRNGNEQLDNLIEITLNTLSSLPSRAARNKVLNSFSQYLYEELNLMREDQMKIAKKLIFNALTLGDSEKLTTEHQIVRVQGASEFMT